MTSAEQKAMMLAVEALEKAFKFRCQLCQGNFAMSAEYPHCHDLSTEKRKEYQTCQNHQFLDTMKILRAALGEQPAPSVGDEERAERLAKIIDLSTENGGAMVCETSYEGDMQSLSIPAATKLISQAFAAIRSESALAASKNADATRGEDIIDHVLTIRKYAAKAYYLNREHYLTDQDSANSVSNAHRMISALAGSKGYSLEIDKAYEALLSINSQSPPIDNINGSDIG